MRSKRRKKTYKTIGRFPGNQETPRPSPGQKAKAEPQVFDASSSQMPPSTRSGNGDRLRQSLRLFMLAFRLYFQDTSAIDEVDGQLSAKSFCHEVLVAPAVTDDKKD